MNVHYLFGEPSTETTSYRDYLKELLAEAKPMESASMFKIKKTMQG